ncbi:MAG: BlaI/MecI/CopY family transcriptional regulator [Chloroflexi bacterium]|nr:BlaI/MecI/CopY family transcriptional regulator [Chloroflexota bacterium]
MENETRELILHPDRKGLRMVLGELEADIMDVIWLQLDGGWCTVRDVYEIMLAERRIAYTTVMNTMGRLAKKSVLESTTRDQAYLYRPSQSRDAFIHGVVGHVLDKLLVQFGGPTQAALAAHIADHPGSEDRIADLLNDITRRRSFANQHLPAEDVENQS